MIRMRRSRGTLQLLYSCCGLQCASRVYLITMQLQSSCSANTAPRLAIALQVQQLQWDRIPVVLVLYAMACAAKLQFIAVQVRSSYGIQEPMGVIWDCQSGIRLVLSIIWR